MRLFRPDVHCTAGTMKKVLTIFVICFSVLTLVGAEQTDCRKGRGLDYFGSTSTAESGTPCQQWRSQYPHTHRYYPESGWLHENFCRNPDGAVRPWCYTMKTDTRWQFCDIPLCTESINCRIHNGANYSGATNVTEQGVSCQRWRAQSPHSHRYFRDDGDVHENFCRNPDSSPRPWCYTTKADTRWQFCDIPLCTPAKGIYVVENTDGPETASVVHYKEDNGCRNNKGLNYSGTENMTEKGIPCQQWLSQKPHTHTRDFHGDAKLHENFCRNPDGMKRPWCYTTNPNIRWQFCDIPLCQDGIGQSSKAPSGEKSQHKADKLISKVTSDYTFAKPTDISLPATPAFISTSNAVSKTTSGMSSRPAVTVGGSGEETSSNRLLSLSRDHTSSISPTNTVQPEGQISVNFSTSGAGHLTESKAEVNESLDTRFDEHRLYDHLMKGYNKASRPVYNASEPVNVKLGITLNQIFDVDEKNQVLTTHIWLDQEWHDEKLNWDPADYNGLQTLRLPCKLIWKPDIVLYNSVDEITGSYMQALAMVSFDGNVFWPPIVRFRSSCEIDITYFPFDDQICKMKLGSWAYDGTQVDVLRRREGVDLSNYVSNGEWELVEAKCIRNVKVYPCCPEPYPDVTCTIHMRRRTLYYTYNVIVPCVMLSSLTLLVFWLTPENGEKVTMGLTVLLSFSVFMLLIAENMPATSFYVPLIGVYITCVMALTASSVILAVFVSNVQARAHTNRPVPACLKKFIHATAKVCCIHISENKKMQKLKPVTQSNAVKLKRLNRNKNGKHPNHIEACYSEMKLKCNGNLETECHMVEIDDEYDHVIDDSSIVKPTSPIMEFEKVLNKLDELIARQDRLIEGNRRSDWTDLAEVVDRLLFYIYVLATLFASIIILVVVPMFKTADASKPS